MINRFQVKNFKSIVDVDVELSPVTVLVGRSGTGKSNFVQAFSVLRDVLISGGNVLQQLWPQLRPAMESEGPATFITEFAIDGIEGRFRYDVSFSATAPVHVPINESLHLGESCLFHQAASRPGQSRWLVEPGLIKVPTPGQIALGRIPSISEIVIAFTALTSGLGCYTFSDRVFCEPPPRNQQASGLTDDGSNFLDVVKDVVTDLHDLKVRKGIISTLKRLNPSVSSVELDSIPNPKSIVVGHQFNGKTLTLDLSQESAGFRRFYAHLLAVYQRPSKQTLVFEHPEDGIHPGALSLLAEEFNAAPAAGRGQVILTTHSPQLLDSFDIGQIRVVELVDLTTRIGLISTEQMDSIRENLLETGELLTVDPARMQLEPTGS